MYVQSSFTPKHLGIVNDTYIQLKMTILLKSEDFPRDNRFINYEQITGHLDKYFTEMGFTNPEQIIYIKGVYSTLKRSFPRNLPEKMMKRGKSIFEEFLFTLATEFIPDSVLQLVISYGRDENIEKHLILKKDKETPVKQVITLDLIRKRDTIMYYHKMHEILNFSHIDVVPDFN